MMSLLPKMAPLLVGMTVVCHVQSGVTSESLSLRGGLAQASLSVCYGVKSGLPFDQLLASNISSLIAINRSFGFLGLPSGFSKEATEIQAKFFSIEVSRLSAKRCPAAVPLKLRNQLERLEESVRD